jgi:hypothetical protein
MYKKGLSKKVANPMQYADDETRKLVAGRGVGEVPLLQKSKTMQILAPFTLEVGNQWKVFRSMVGEKDAAGIITYLVAAYGLNQAIEHVRGSGVAYDPIDALIDGYKGKDGSKKDKILAAIGSLAGETIGNIPGGNLITGSVGMSKQASDKLFQGRSPDRFGTGVIGLKTAKDVLNDPTPKGVAKSLATDIALPFGGTQLKKSMEGLDAIKKKGVYTKKGEMMYPIKPSLMKSLQLGTFGKYSSKEARDFFNAKQKPLSIKQTQRVESKATDEERIKEYAKILAERKLRREQRSK